MNSGYSFNVFWSDKDEAFIAVSPEFPNLSAFGDTPEEALAELQPIIEIAIEGYKENGWPLPTPRPQAGRSGQLLLRLPRNLHAAAALHAGLDDVSLNTWIVAALAEKLGMTAIKNEVVHALNQVAESMDALVSNNSEILATVSTLTHEANSHHEEEVRLIQKLEEEQRRGRIAMWRDKEKEEASPSGKIAAFSWEDEREAGQSLVGWLSSIRPVRQGKGGAQ